MQKVNGKIVPFEMVIEPVVEEIEIPVEPTIEERLAALESALLS